MGCGQGNAKSFCHRTLPLSENAVGVTLYGGHILCTGQSSSLSNYKCEYNITLPGRRLYSEHFSDINLIEPYNNPLRNVLPFTDDKTKGGDLP